MNWGDYVYISLNSPTGLRWKVNILDSRGHQTKARKDGVAGGLSPEGYGRVQVNGSQELCHRVIYKLVHGEVPDNLVVDHLDGNPKNNHPDNLKLKTLQENNQNVKKSSANKSGTVGVYFILNRFGTEYVEAAWYEEGKKKRTRKFSCKKYGRDVAFDMACKVRSSAIEELRLKGFDYTERHGV